MPITSFTIGGVEVEPLLETFEIRETSGSVSTLVCDVDSAGSPALRFDLHSEVIVKEDGVRIFAGTVTQTREQGFGGPNLYDEDSGAPQIVTSITAEDWFRLADRVYITAAVAEGTLLKAFLVTLVAGDLGDLGVTLDTAQADGPALPAMSFTRKRGSEVLTALTDATGYLSRVDYDKKLRMSAPGQLVAPFDIDEDDIPARWTGDVEVEAVLGDNYANRVTVVSDPLTVESHVETFTGDGVTSVFQLEYTLLKHYGYVTDDLNATPDPINKTLTETAFQGSADWTYHPANNTLERELGPLPLGQVAEFKFDGTFQAEAVAEDAAAIADPNIGLYAYVEQRNDITTNAAAQSLADALLADKLTAGDHIVNYDTRYPAPTLRAGQEQTLTAPARAVSGAHLITDMRVRAETPVTVAFDASGLGLIRSITAKKNQLGDKWQGTYHDWLDKGGGGSGVNVEVGSGGPGGIGPALPDTSIQSNQGGKFYGKATLVFYASLDSMALGDGSSVTASLARSCGAFGSNCHVSD